MRVRRLRSRCYRLLEDAWERVERSGVLETRMLMVELDPSLQHGLDGAAAEAAARGLRNCALVGCSAREVHVAQFKKCGGCLQAFYCCREHQVADWPRHKAACKAARKAAPAKKKQAQ